MAGLLVSFLGIVFYVMDCVLCYGLCFMLWIVFYLYGLCFILGLHVKQLTRRTGPGKLELPGRPARYRARRFHASPPSLPGLHRVAVPRWPVPRPGGNFCASRWRMTALFSIIRADFSSQNIFLLLFFPRPSPIPN